MLPQPRKGIVSHYQEEVYQVKTSKRFLKVHKRNTGCTCNSPQIATRPTASELVLSRTCKHILSQEPLAALAFIDFLGLLALVFADAFGFSSDDPDPGVFLPPGAFKLLAEQLVQLDMTVYRWLRGVLERTTRLFKATSVRVHAEQCCKISLEISGLQRAGFMRLLKRILWKSLKHKWIYELVNHSHLKNAYCWNDCILCLSDRVTATSFCKVSSFS